MRHAFMEHDLFRKPVPTPHHVRGKLFGIMLYGGDRPGREKIPPTSENFRAPIGNKIPTPAVYLC